MAFREEARMAARLRMAAVDAAAATVVIVGAIWMVYRSLGPHRDTNVTYQANLLDLREKSALLAAGASLTGAPIELPRAAAHASELQTARSYGLRTGFIYRPNEYGGGPVGVPAKAKPGDFDVVSVSIIDLAQQMGA